eukprot:TRINITY_DN4391_c0_g1_i1.p1 TRINITY_DN4391_c0_g1~~TRINITY_DN4391_c0_g1_i1.p1  ORF type:complete len:487 (+),score=142.84 TRINITY_DN4391_c0_g1_i1:193-1653(+)
MDFSEVIRDSTAKLKALPRKPTWEQVEKAHRSIAAIDKKLVAKVEALLAVPVPPGIDPSQFRELQKTKQEMASAEAEAEKKQHLPILELDELHRHYEGMIRGAEKAVAGLAEAQAEAEALDKMRVSRKFADDLKEVLTEQPMTVDWKFRELTSLPETIGKLTFVTTLDLSQNFLTSLPDAIAGMQNLHVLILSSNKLKQLPDSIGALAQLRRLEVNMNELKEIPESIYNCTNLEELNVTFNRLEKLPDKLGNHLVHLRVLKCGLNMIKYLPSTLGGLRSLVRLDMHFNQLHEVRTSIGSLSNLEYLDLSDNFSDLTALPASIGELANLVELNVCNNQIHELPVECGKLTRLQKVLLDGNPWTAPPLELVQKKDLPALLEYLHQRYQDSLVAAQSKASESYYAMWAPFLSNVFGGNWFFSEWLNGMLTDGSSLNRLQQIRSSGDLANPTTEMRALAPSREERDVEGGGGGMSSAAFLPTSALVESVA